MDTHIYIDKRCAYVTQAYSTLQPRLGLHNGLIKSGPSKLYAHADTGISMYVIICLAMLVAIPYAHTYNHSCVHTLSCSYVLSFTGPYGR